MSYTLMLRHRCNVLELGETVTDGMPTFGWTIVAENVRCFLDLNFIRQGKDPIWTPEAGRAEDRSGVLFIAPKAPIKTGNRVAMLRGPSGVFEIQGAIDEAWTPTKLHHLEVGVKEIGRPIAKGAPTQ